MFLWRELLMEGKELIFNIATPSYVLKMFVLRCVRLLKAGNHTEVVVHMVVHGKRASEPSSAAKRCRLTYLAMQ